MYVVSEVSKRVAEFVRVLLYQAHLLGNINETAKAPLMKGPYFRTSIFRRGLGGIELPWVLNS